MDLEFIYRQEKEKKVHQKRELEKSNALPCAKGRGKTKKRKEKDGEEEDGVESYL